MKTFRDYINDAEALLEMAFRLDNAKDKVLLKCKKLATLVTDVNGGEEDGTNIYVSVLSSKNFGSDYKDADEYSHLSISDITDLIKKLEKDKLISKLFSISYTREQDKDVSDKNDGSYRFGIKLIFTPKNPGDVVSSVNIEKELKKLDKNVLFELKNILIIPKDRAKLMNALNSMLS